MFICSSICPSSERTEDQLRAKHWAGCGKSRQRSEAWPLPSEDLPGGVGTDETHKSCGTVVGCAKCQVRVPLCNTRSGRQGFEIKQGRICRGGAPWAGL